MTWSHGATFSGGSPGRAPGDDPVCAAPRGVRAPVAVRLRRDFGSLLALIRAHAVLHQASRARDNKGRIVATLDDYAVVRDLVADAIAEGVGATVSETVRETVAAVAALASGEGVGLG